MRWSPNVIAGFARHAGFRGDALTIAVAVALYGTGGDDLAHVATIPPTGYDQRGLWLIDVVAYQATVDVDLFDPRVNAGIAYGLYTAADSTWGWSPVYPAGGWRDLLTVAAQAVTQAGARQPLGYGAERAASSRSVIDKLNDLGRVLPPREA